MNYARLIELHDNETREGLREVLKEGRLDLEVDLGRLYEECLGWHDFRECRRNPRHHYGNGFVRHLQEAAGAVATDRFLNITGQIMFTWVMEPYEMEEPVFSQLIPEVGPVATLQQEKIPRLTHIGDEAQLRYETDPYALAGFGEDWIYRPQIRDRGFIVPLTWEVLFEGNAKQLPLQEMARKNGDWMRVNKEKRAIDCVIDENTTDHRYNWRGVKIATYGDNSGNHSWDNLQAANQLVDWSDLDNAKQLVYAITDPYTGEPLPIRLKHLIAPLGLEQTVGRILTATELRITTPGFAVSANPTQTTRDNPYRNALTYVSSRLLAARQATDTDWFVGDIGLYAKSFWAEKMNVLQAPPDHPDNFSRRIAQQWRVNEMQEFGVVEPRAMEKNTVA
jgi:hypothetical protein